MNHQVNKLGSQRKVSVSAPKGSKPNLIFKAPTYIFRVSKILSPRQGGSHYPVVHGLFLIFLALTVMVLRVRTKIDMTFKLCKPLNNTLSYCTFLQIPMLMEDLKGVYSIDLKTFHKSSLPPE